MREVIEQSGEILPTIEFHSSERLRQTLPIVAPIVIALVFILTRLFYGQHAFLYESALTMLALMSYLTAAALLITNFLVKENYLSLAGLVSVSVGYCFNLSGWMIRWIEAGEKEGWIGGKVWRYFPLDNLYSLTIGFCAGGALATLVIIRNPKYRVLGALAMPIISVIMLQAFFFGGEIRTLPPILSSYWLPMHVSTATFGYGAALASFGIALAYLIKDRVRVEAFGIVITLFALIVLSAASNGSILFHGEYGPSLMFENQDLPVRSILPYVGHVYFVSFLGFLAALILFIAGWKGDKTYRSTWAWRLFGLATITVGLGIGLMFFEISQANNPAAFVASRDYSELGSYLAKNMEANVPASQLGQMAQNWARQNESRLALSSNSNPIEFASFVALLVSLMMTGLIAMKREAIIDSLPSLETLDALLYRTVGVVVPLLSLLLITGAVWANESWGRYWGWDPKEVGALLSWIVFAGYLHLRFVAGWTGRRSVYVVLLGFSLVIFTWLGVTYLLPGLHSYA
jgi:cytochrome c-type biogenesis protein CcsB